MTLRNLDKAPFPWFGGKSAAADLVWALIGDVPHYVEPFFGSGAVLLGRPHPANRSHYSETANDLDGFVVNFWRAMKSYPVETACAASWPVAEADKTARQIALLRWRDESLERLAGDAEWCCPIMAGWWAWALSVQIGAFDGKSAWAADPETGRIFKQARGATREPGVTRDRPPLVGDGQGVNHAGTREPGVLDPPSGSFMLDELDWGAAYHGCVMPELVRWFRHLAARLRHVRVLNGDWSRVVTKAAAWTLPVRMKKDGVAGVFLDPPYADTASRSKGLYAQDSLTVAHDVREWCIANGGDPKWRIVLAGFDGEHGTALTDAGWREIEWFRGGFLVGGMGNTRRDGSGKRHQQHRERFWASPHCLPLDGEDVAADEDANGLFAGERCSSEEVQP